MIPKSCSGCWVQFTGVNMGTYRILIAINSNSEQKKPNHLSSGRNWWALKEAFGPVALALVPMNHDFGLSSTRGK